MVLYQIRKLNAYKYEYCIDRPLTWWLDSTKACLSSVFFPPVMPTDILAPTCQSASFRGSFFPHRLSTLPTVTRPGTGPWEAFLQPEWKPGAWPGPVAHISHFCKPCHSIGSSSRLEVCPSLCFFWVCSFLAPAPRGQTAEENRLKPNFYLLSNVWKGSISSMGEDVYCICNQ